MIEIIDALKDSNVPTIAALAGVFLIFLAIGVEGAIKLPPNRRRPAGVVGAILLIIGIGLFLVPNLGSQTVAAPNTNSPTALAQSIALGPTTLTLAPTELPEPELTVVTTPAPTPMVTPSALPEGFHRLQESIYGRFDPAVPGDVALDTGRIYHFMGERTGRYCRAEFPPNGLIWVLCIKIDEPDPTQTPSIQMQAPPAPPRSTEGVASVTYRVDIVAISLEQIKALPGCENLQAANNVCIVGLGGVNLELYNYQEGATHSRAKSNSRYYRV